MGRSPYEAAVLSNTAAQAIYDKIAEQDVIIAHAKNEVDLANASIAFNVQNARVAYEKRQTLAGELAGIAADDFVPSLPVSPMASPPSPPSMRFHVPPPFSTSRLYGTRGRQQETDNEF